MSFKDLVQETECGGANPLMRLGNQLKQDRAYQDEGFSGRSSTIFSSNENQLVSEFMGQIAPQQPQSFRMNVLLKEMREIDAHQQKQIIPAPAVIQQVNQNDVWTAEFTNSNRQSNNPVLDSKLNTIWSHSLHESSPQPFSHPLQQPIGPLHHNPVAGSTVNWTREFFEINEPKVQTNQAQASSVIGAQNTDQFNYSEFLNFMNKVSEGNSVEDDTWSNEFYKMATGSDVGATGTSDETEDWVKSFENSRQANIEESENYNKQFWERLQDEWRKISEDGESDKHPWLSEFSDYTDPYKEYKFDEENPMLNIDNAFEKGKQFMEQGDIPSAVLCFESAVKQQPENQEIWEMLGISQAENEKDPNAIAALNKALTFDPNNMNVLMALAVSYTNESLQSQALKMLVRWLKCNEKYSNLVPHHLQQLPESVNTTSLIRGPELIEVQDLFLKAAQQSPSSIDADIQEALGVLFNLSSEYDKAVDCFRAALHQRPNNSKTWNRLGASLANGNRSVEAVEAYQRALEIRPGFIRARYNVGIICINLKAYNEAVEHLLTALNHQATSMSRSGLNSSAAASTQANQMSSTVWSTLRMAISLMGRHDLQPAIDRRDLDTLNKEFKTITEEAFSS
uniref:Peroxisomal targeting signal 1 receptor n=1 Tax=Corethrella appendiculata TaxID=1370023 RepID=U5EYI5_9DIPT